MLADVVRSMDVFPFHIIVVVLEEDTFNVELEAHLENFTHNDWPIEEIPVLLPGNKGGKEDIKVINGVEHDLTE